MARLFIQLPNTAPTAPHSCSCGSCGKSLPACLRTSFLYCWISTFHLPGELDVVVLADLFLMLLQQVLELILAHVHHDIGVHLDEAAMAVVGEALVAGQLHQVLHRLVVEAEVEHRVHHAGIEARAPERTRPAAAALGRAELGAHDLLDVRQAGMHCSRRSGG